MKDKRKLFILMTSLLLFITMIVGTTNVSQAAESWLWPVPSSRGLNQYYHDGHDGLDINGQYGCSVVATMSGTVVYSRYGDIPETYYGGGNFVVIRHDNGYYSHYAHLDSRTVSEGQWVAQGQVIGKMGSTGVSTGTHLHFAIATRPYGAGGRINTNPGVINYVYTTQLDVSFSNQRSFDVTTTTAKVAFSTNNPSNATMTNFGIRIKEKAKPNWERSFQESYTGSYSVFNTEYVIGTGQEINYTLRPGTSYAWQPFTVSGGKYYYGSTNTFTTAASSHTHSYKSTITKATFTANGSIAKKCSCGNVLKQATIYSVSGVKLSATAYTYNGKVKTPAVTVKDSKGKKLVKNTDYTVSYGAGRKYIGRYTVKITLKGNYKGTKLLSFTVNPKGTSLSKLSSTKGGFKVTWRRQTTQTTGYQLQYATDRRFSTAKKVTFSRKSTNSTSISKLFKGRRYYVRIRTYKKVGSKVYYSSWSNVKYITTKK